VRRDQLDRQLKRIHWKIPKWLYARCIECHDDIKGETMWWYRTWSYGPGGVARYKKWVCRRCAPKMSDLLRICHEDFEEVDYSAIVEEEKQLAKYNERSTDA
jgi:hypothetical protein